jgi:transglutaminase/protease-like cytokinesis protein 3
LSQDYQEIDERAKSIKYTKDYKSAAKELASNYDSQELIARAIFTWIVYNIEYDHRQENNVQPGKKVQVEFTSKEEYENYFKDRIASKIETTLKRRKGICQDFSWLYQVMLAEVGIECEFVSGHGRTDPGELGRIPKIPSHAWNAAKIDGEWALFDLTWSTSMFETEENGFFMFSAKEFLKTHFPSEEKWQLLEEPMSIEDWAKTIYWYKIYSKYKVKSLTVNDEPHENMYLPYNSELKLSLDLSPDKSLYAMKNQGQKRVKLTKSGDVYSLDIADSKLRGRTTICIVDGNKIFPLLEFRIE